MSHRMLTAVLGALALAPQGCAEHASSLDALPHFEVAIETHTSVDILFVVDNSNSMAEEQAALAAGAEAFFRQLIDPETDGGPLVEDLHVGVTTTDMGTGGYTIMTCANSMYGDDGALQSDGRLVGCPDELTSAGCPSGGCPWLSHSTTAPDDGRDPEDPPLWDDFACIASLGTGGCGFEQQLEASLVALTSQVSEGGANEGFLREGSVLAVVHVTDEDDCSARDPALFDPTHDDLGPLCVRCILAEPLMAHPLERYVDGLRALRPAAEDRLVFAAIAGFPLDGAWREDLSGWAAEVRDGIRCNPSNPNELLPSCESPMGFAFPPVRLGEVVAAFGDAGVAGSTCETDWSETLGRVASAIQARLATACASQPISQDDCRLVETRSDGAPCPDLETSDRAEGWRRDLGLDPLGRRRCGISPTDGACEGCALGRCEAPTPASCQRGWHLAADSACDNGQVRLSGGDVAPADALHLECRQEER